MAPSVISRCWSGTNSSEVRSSVWAGRHPLPHSPIIMEVQTAQEYSSRIIHWRMVRFRPLAPDAKRIRYSVCTMRIAACSVEWLVFGGRGFLSWDDCGWWWWFEVE